MSSSQALLVGGSLETRKAAVMAIASIVALAVAVSLIPVFTSPGGVGFGDAQSIEMSAQEALAKIAPKLRLASIATRTPTL